MSPSANNDMRTLTAGELLALWESGLSMTPPERALALLGAVVPEMSREALAALPIGQRDAQLLRFREGLWGREMSAVVVCPQCSDKLELSLDIQAFVGFPSGEVQEGASLDTGGHKMELCLPTSTDIMSALESSSSEDPGTLILQRCIRSIEKDGHPVTADNLPQEVVEKAVKCIAEADPLADIRLDVTCPSCTHRWKAAFDIVSFLWTELEVWTSRILMEVHALARAYGWSEREILALSPLRRQYYLEMVGA